MLYLGIDIGKHSHSLCLLNDNGKESIWQMDNTKQGFEKLRNKLISEDLLSAKDKLLIGMESTGHYFLNLYSFFLELGFKGNQIALLNPLQVKSFRNTNIRGSKSDNVDAKRIAVLLKFGEFDCCNVNIDKMMNLRELTRLKANLVANSATLKRKMIAVTDRIFPEFTQIFANKFGKTALALLEDYPTPEAMAELSLDDLTDIVKSLSKRGISSDKIKQLHTACRNSIGIAFGKESFKIELHLLIENLKLLQNQIDYLKKKIEAIVSELNSPIFSIPGVGVSTGATILSEIGDISHFKSAVKLIAFAGLDPKLRESGSYQGRTPISKRGSKYLRNALWYSAMVACRAEPTFKKFYTDRREKGKSHRYTVTAAANRLTKVVYHILKNNCTFDPSKLM